MRGGSQSGNGSGLPDGVERRVERIFVRQLHVEVPDRETDLIDAGLVDSLALVQLLATLEREFEIPMDLNQLDLDDFRSVSSIAAFVDRSSGREEAPAGLSAD